MHSTLRAELVSLLLLVSLAPVPSHADHPTLRGLRGILDERAAQQRKAPPPPLRGGGSAPATNSARGTGARYFDSTAGQFSHDIGTGDYGDEKWTRANVNLDNLGPVTRVPEDLSRVDIALEYMSRVRRASSSRLDSILAVGPGSFLLPRRFKEVSVPENGWPFAQSHPPIWMNGKRTRALVPDDGAEPKKSPQYPHEWLPEHGDRFVNITLGLQVIGAEGGWLREMVLLNQEESVVVVEAGDWKIEGCLLAAASRGVMGSDVIIVRNRCTVILHLTTIQPLWPGDPGPDWAAWPPGQPANGGGFRGLTQLPAEENAMPQRGYVMLGLYACGVSKVSLDSCTLQGCVVAVRAAGEVDLQLDRCLLRWNQVGVLGAEAARPVVRDSELLDNVYGALRLDGVHDVESTHFALYGCMVRGPLWASELRPGTDRWQDWDNEVLESPQEFTQGPGRHVAVPEFDAPQYGAGGWEIDWKNAPGFEWVPPLGEDAPADPPIDQPLSAARREAIFHSLSVASRHAPEVPRDDPEDIQPPGYHDGDREFNEE